MTAWLLAALDDLLLPYQIDLSLMASLSHPDLLDHILRVGVVLYAKNGAPLEVCSFENQSCLFYLP